MADNDETLALRRRARRRLVGAVALVLALVIVPPWLMDLEPKPVATNLTVEIPRPETGVLKPAPPPKAAPAKAGTPAAAAGAPATAAAAAAAPPAADKQGGVPRPPDVSPSTGKVGEPAKAASAKAPPKPETVARAAPAPADPDAKRAEAILNSEAYLVPLGAFANKDNVKALEAKLAKAGVKYYTEVVTTPGGEQTRVRAGPFPTKEAAEQSREQLKGLGLSPGSVIARQ